MAGSRLESIGTIFSRTTGLLKSGAMKYKDRPIWYDVYRVFPPKYEPYCERVPAKTVEEVPQIFYKEDKVRALFFKRFGPNPDGKARKLSPEDLTAGVYAAAYQQDASQEFVNSFNHLQEKNPGWTFEQIFNSVSEQYEKSRPPPPSSDSTGFRRGRRMIGSSSDRTQIQSQDEEGDEEGESVSAKLLGQQDELGEDRKRGPKLLTAESLRSLFEEAQKSQGQDDVKTKENKKK